MDQPDIDLMQPVLAKYASMGRTALLPVLHSAQKIYGYLPEPVTREIASALNIPLSEISGVIDFYALFRRKPVGKTLIHVCNDPACAIAGSDGVMKRMTRKYEGHLQKLSSESSITIERSPCLGLCEHAPAILVQGIGVPSVGRKTWMDLDSGKFDHPHTILGGDFSL